MSKKTIKIYSSYNESSEDRAVYAASLSPIECLRQTVELIAKVYPNRINSKKITILYKDEHSF